MIAESTPATAAIYDSGLIARFNAGDLSAFDEIVQRYRRRLHKVVFRFLYSATDAEEVVQATFVAAHRALDRFRGECSLYSWLYRIAVNLARNRYAYWRTRRKHQSVALETPLSEESKATIGDMVASPAASPVVDAATEEFVSAVAHCMEQLKPKQRVILDLCVCQDLSYEEIAEAAGINLGTVKSRVSRARESLKKLLEAHVPDFRACTTLMDYFEPRSASGDHALNPR